MIISSSAKPEDGTIQLAASCSYIHLLPNWPPSHSGDQVLAMTAAAQRETPACWHHNYTASPTTGASGSNLSERNDRGGTWHERILKSKWRGGDKREGGGWWGWAGGEEAAVLKLVQPWDYRLNDEKQVGNRVGEDWIRERHRRYRHLKKMLFRSY